MLYSEQRETFAGHVNDRISLLYNKIYKSNKENVNKHRLKDQMVLNALKNTLSHTVVFFLIN